MILSRDLAESAVDAAGALDGCIALVRESSEANLRWARNTLTTTGESRSREITLVGFRRGPGGMATATASLSSPEPADLPALAGRLESALAGAAPAEDAAPLLSGESQGAWAPSAPHTDGSVFSETSGELGHLLRSALDRDVELFGYAEHSVHATWLASSTGLRCHHVQPQGRLEITAKSHGRTRSAWWGTATDNFGDIDWSGAEHALHQSLAWQARDWDIAPGRHRVILSPGAVGDLMVDLWWSATARASEDSSKSATVDPIVKVRTGTLDSCWATATTVELSIPPDRNAPTGTSATIRRRTDRRSSRSSSSTESSGEPPNVCVSSTSCRKSQ